jgi:hypothetical protein
MPFKKMVSLTVVRLVPKVIVAAQAVDILAVDAADT